MEPRTAWQEQDGVRSGGAVTVRAAAFPVGGGTRGGVTPTARAPDPSSAPAAGGAAVATLLLDPDEARGFAAPLEEAAGAADRPGPPLHGR